jgi:NAD(P)-dependent dehydrogenase (short-subunit alcohol dehydrogenase family)
MSEQTIARLAAIRSHIDRAPRSGRLSDKVCILTGVSGFRKAGGGGSGAAAASSAVGGGYKSIGQATAWLFAHEGARHLYLLDLRSEGLDEFAKAIRDRYPDVKVINKCAFAPPPTFEGE